jgi:hypothetical protein
MIPKLHKRPPGNHKLGEAVRIYNDKNYGHTVVRPYTQTRTRGREDEDPVFGPAPKMLEMKQE